MDKTLEEIVDLFEIHELSNLAWMIEDRKKDVKEFEEVYYKTTTSKDLLLIVEDAFQMSNNTESIIEKVNKLNETECEKLVKELSDNFDKHFIDPENELE